MLPPRLFVSSVGEYEPAADTIEKIGRRNTNFSYWDVVSTVARKILRLQVASWGLRWKLLTEMRLIWIEPETTGLSRPYDCMCWPRLSSPAGEIMIGVEMFPKRRGDPNVP